jgi:hypothetical protein
VRGGSVSIRKLSFSAFVKHVTSQLDAGVVTKKGHDLVEGRKICYNQAWPFFIGGAEVARF